MSKADALGKLYEQLKTLYDDRDDLADLARDSDLPIADIAAGENTGAFLRNILLEAHGRSKVEALIKSAVFEHGDPAGALKEAYDLYDSAGNGPDVESASTLLLFNTPDEEPAVDDDESAGGEAGDEITVGDISGGTGFAIGSGAKSIVNNIQNTFHSTITHFSRRALWSAVLGLLLIVAVLFWGSFGTQVMAYFTPLWMTEDFNIAIVEFGEIQQTTGALSASTDGSEMSAWLTDGLTDSYQQFSLVDNPKTVGIVHSSSPEAAGQRRKLGAFLSADPAARCDAAEALAGDINAQMVIYGTLDKRNSPAQIELLFYISPSVQSWLELNDIETGSNSAITDCLPLGELLSVPQPFSDAEVRDYVQDNVASRGSIFFWLTLGLIQDRQGDWENALPYFRQVETHLDRLQQTEARKFGADLVAALIGQQYLRQLGDEIDNRGDINLDQLDLSLLDKAAENYQKAIEYNGSHQHRAQKGMGDVWAFMGRIAQKVYYQEIAADAADAASAAGAEDAEDAGILEISSKFTSAIEIVPSLLTHHQNMAQALAHALDHYEKAAAHVTGDDDPHVSLVIDFALAEIIWAEGQLFYINDDRDEAIPKMTTFLKMLNNGNKSLLGRAEEQRNDRIITQAYRLSGLTYFQLSDMLRMEGRFDERLTNLQHAEDFFNRCISKAQNAILDKLISNELVADFCLPKLDDVKQAVEDAQAHAGEQP